MKTFYKSISLLFLISPFLVFNSFSQQAPGIEWQNTIGGSDEDNLYFINQTADGGFIMGGRSISDISGDKTENSIGSYDFWIVKTYSSGNIQWQNTIGGNINDGLYSIKQTADGGYICGGYSYSNISGDKTENCLGGSDYWLVKTDLTGYIQWQNTIGGNDHDELNSIQQTADGGYILGGWSVSNISGDKTENSMGGYDYWIVKTNSSGTIQWQNTIGGNDQDFLYSIQQTADGGYILGGFSQSNISGDKTENCLGGSDYWIVKTDSSGTIQWQNTIGGDTSDVLLSIGQTTDGGYILGGFSVSNISGDKTENNWDPTLLTEDYWIVKTDASGSIQWQNTIGGTDDDELYSMQQTADGGYILGGRSGSFISGDKTEDCIGANDYWIVKTDASGSIQWQNTIGGNSLEWLYSIQQTADSGYILGGHSKSNISGDKTENCLGLVDYWIVKLFPDTITGISPTPALPGREGVAIAPNPSHGIFQITFPSPSSNQKTNYTLEVINTLGQSVYQAPLPASPRWGEESSALSLDLSFLPKGIYVLRLCIPSGKISDGINSFSQKLVIQ